MPKNKIGGKKLNVEEIVVKKNENLPLQKMDKHMVIS